MAVFRKIAVPVDADSPEAAEQALEAATRLAGASGAALTVIGVQPGVLENSGRPPAAYRRKLLQLLARQAGPSVVAEVREVSGAEPELIRKTLDEIGADLLVMSGRDRRLARDVIGSDVIDVAIETPCSVLVVR